VAVSSIKVQWFSNVPTWLHFKSSCGFYGNSGPGVTCTYH
jgi:hypothetical protein